MSEASRLPPVVSKRIETRTASISNPGRLPRLDEQRGLPGDVDAVRALVGIDIKADNLPLTNDLHEILRRDDIPWIRLSLLHRQTSRSAKPESVRLSFQEQFAQPKSLLTLRTSSSGKTIQTKPYHFQSEPALTSLAWEREQF